MHNGANWGTLPSEGIGFLTMRDLRESRLPALTSMWILQRRRQLKTGHHPLQQRKVLHNHKHHQKHHHKNRNLYHKHKHPQSHGQQMHTYNMHKHSRMHVWLSVTKPKGHSLQLTYNLPTTMPLVTKGHGQRRSFIPSECLCKGPRSLAGC